MRLLSPSYESVPEEERVGPLVTCPAIIWLLLSLYAPPLASRDTFSVA